jgi:hypothetical protein
VLDRVVQARLRAAEKYKQSPIVGVSSISEWPWSWLRVSQLIQVFDNVRELASLKKSPIPPKEIILDYERAKEFIETNAKDKDNEDEE